MHRGALEQRRHARAGHVRRGHQAEAQDETAPRAVSARTRTFEASASLETAARPDRERQAARNMSAQLRDARAAARLPSPRRASLGRRQPCRPALLLDQPLLLQPLRLRPRRGLRACRRLAGPPGSAPQSGPKEARKWRAEEVAAERRSAAAAGPVAGVVEAQEACLTGGGSGFGPPANADALVPASPMSTAVRASAPALSRRFGCPPTPTSAPPHLRRTPSTMARSCGGWE